MAAHEARNKADPRDHLVCHKIQSVSKKIKYILNHDNGQDKRFLEFPHSRNHGGLEIPYY